jgi:HSP20 family protein
LLLSTLETINKENISPFRTHSFKNTMKFYASPVAAVLVAANSIPSSSAYSCNVGPNNCCPPSTASTRTKDGYFSSSPRFNRYRQRQQRVDQAFRDLQNEMNDTRRRRSRNKPTTGQFDFMMMDPFSVDFEEVDKEAVKKWVDKAFELASEFNQDFSRSSQEREQNDELLQKSREWVENIYQNKQTDEEVEALNDNAASAPPATEGATQVSTDGERDAEKNDVDAKTPVAAKESEIIIPYSENQSDETTFVVAVDLPGIDRGDVDLTLEKDYLVVQARRLPRDEQASDSTRIYLKKFAVVEDEIEVDKIEASLNNGVLTVSAPKKKQENKDTKIKIPLA